MYSLTTGMCYELKDNYETAKKTGKLDTWHINCENFIQFMMDNFETELVVMGTKLALTQYQLPLDPDEIKCFDDFHAKYGKYIAAATEKHSR